MRSLQKEKIGEKRYVSTENPCSLWYRWLFLTGGWPPGDGGRHLHFLLILLLLAWLNYLDENGRSHLTGQFIISAVFSFWNTLTNYKNLSVCKVYAVYFRFPLSRQVIDTLVISSSPLDLKRCSLPHSAENFQHFQFLHGPLHTIGFQNIWISLNLCEGRGVQVIMISSLESAAFNAFLFN